MKKSLMLILFIKMLLLCSCIKQSEVKYTISTYYECSKTIHKIKDTLSNEDIKTHFNLCLAQSENIKEHRFD